MVADLVYHSNYIAMYSAIRPTK